MFTTLKTEIMPLPTKARKCLLRKIVKLIEGMGNIEIVLFVKKEMQ